MEKKRIAIAVGGTGGHVLPAQVFGSRASKFADIFYVGVGLKKNPYMKCQQSVFDVEGGNFSKGAFQGLYKILRGTKAARKILLTQRIDHVVGFGSYHSLPVILAAKILNIPFSLVETNVLPGKVNRFLSRWAKMTMIQFDPARQRLKGLVQPISFDLRGEQKMIAKKEARLHFGLDPDKKTILVFGGSQGAEVINQCLAQIAEELDKDCQLIHLTGKETDLAAIYKKAGLLAHVATFSNEMELAWSASDFVICRAGAGALREMLVFERPGILIPFPGSKEGHQKKNAEFMHSLVRGGIHLDQNNLFASTLLEQIISLLADEKRGEYQAHLQEYKNREKRPDIIERIQEII